MNTNKLLSYIVLAIIILGVILLLSRRAEAGTATISITPATTMTDGTAIPAALKAPASVEWSACNADLTFGAVIQGTAVFPSATATSVTINSASIADNTTCFRAFTNLTDGRKSVPSATFSKFIPPIPPALPNPPTITTITTVAYEYRQHWYGDRMVSVGRVARGEVCGEALKVRGRTYNALSASQVTLGGGYRGGAIYGRCA